MTSHTVTQAAVVLALTMSGVGRGPDAGPTDPAQALLGRVESEFTQATWAVANPRMPDGVGALLNRVIASDAPVVPSPEQSPRDRATVALLGWSGVR